LVTPRTSLARQGLVVCALPGNAHSGNDAVANPGFSTFIQGLAAP
jgi:hypothetical protein